jgi:RNA polymerase nonessential primary-like sigma factor
MAQHEILTVDEEIRLIREAQAGDATARGRLIAANMGLIAQTCRSLTSTSKLPLEDAIQEGVIGYLEGICRFDPAWGRRLSNIAFYRVRHRVQEAIHDSMRIRAPLRTPGYRVDVTGTTRERAEAARRCAAASDVSRADQVDWETLFGPGHGDPAGEPSPSDCAAEAGRIRRWMGDLGPREREVIARRFGLDGRPESTLQEIGRDLGGITRERVHQIEKKAMEKLRESAGVGPDG